MSSFEARPLEADAVFEPMPLGEAAAFAPQHDREARRREREAEAQAALEAAREQGRDEGRAEALAEHGRALLDALEAAQALRREYLMRNREAVVELAIGIAEQLLRGSLGADGSVLLSVLEHALASAPAHEPLRVRLAAVDRELLEQQHAASLQRLAAEREIVFEDDAALGRGDLRVLGVAAEVDARIASLLEGVRAGLAPLAVTDARTDTVTDALTDASTDAVTDAVNDAVPAAERAGGAAPGAPEDADS